MNKWQIICPLTAMLIAASVFAAGIPFPEKDSCFSPKKNWKIDCKRDAADEGEYKFILRNVKDGETAEIFKGGRWSQVLWKRDETYLAITDWSGSNESDILLKKLDVSGPAETLRKFLDMKKIGQLLGKDALTGHCYFEALKWEKDGQLRFHVFGHTDTNPSREFSRTFLFQPTNAVLTVIGRTKQK